MYNISFGASEEVLNKRTFWQQYLETPTYNGYYLYPVNLKMIATTFRANVHNSSAIYCKKNIINQTFIDSKILSFANFDKIIFEYLTLGNCYLQLIRNGKKIIKAKYIPAVYTFKSAKNDGYVYINAGNKIYYSNDNIVHICQQDFFQEIYGVPDYLSSLNSIFLNESATLFRRRYYQNGAHMGNIFFLNAPGISQEEEKILKNKIENSKSIGNFKNLFINGRGKKDFSVELIPVGNLSTKDEFASIKNISRDDVLAAWRIPPGLMSIIPTNTGGFGDIEKAAKVYFTNEIKPIHRMLFSINHAIGENIFNFGEYSLLDG